MPGFHSFLCKGSSEFNIFNKIAGDIMRMGTVMCDSVWSLSAISYQVNPIPSVLTIFY